MRFQSNFIFIATKIDKNELNRKNAVIFFARGCCAFFFVLLRFEAKCSHRGWQSFAWERSEKEGGRE